MNTNNDASSTNSEICGVLRCAEGYRLSVHTSIYSIEAIKKASYKFADRASVIINPEAAESVSVIFNFVGASAQSNPDVIISEFCNELLDQDLREIVKRETEPL